MYCKRLCNVVRFVCLLTCQIKFIKKNFFKLERGVSQGCPLLTYLIILGVEILAEKYK